MDHGRVVPDPKAASCSSARGDQRKLSAAGHAASHEHWLRTIATADWSKTCRRRTNMHKKLARLVTWLAEMLDRNRSWFPKSTNLKPPRRPLGRTCNHCAFRSPSALTQVTLRMSDCRTRQTHARAIWSAFTGFEKLAAVVRYEVHQKVRYAVNVSCKSCRCPVSKLRLAGATTRASSTTLGRHGNYSKSRTHAEPERLRADCSCTLRCYGVAWPRTVNRQTPIAPSSM